MTQVEQDEQGQFEAQSSNARGNQGLPKPARLGITCSLHHSTTALVEQALRDANSIVEEIPFGRSFIATACC